ncbi:DNA mismatch repair protein MutS [Parabacteroides distasonis]|nr:DNA mismatch repair protein MutS [Parabacteroides distasonis]
MEQLYTFYEEQIALHRARLNALKRRMHQIGTLRLLLVIGALIALWLLRAESGTLLGMVFVAFALPFGLLMMWHNRLDARKTHEETLMELNQNERKGLDYDFSAFDGAPEKADSQHAFSLDLDLFGEPSLFQSLNRTVTTFGKERLAHWFLQPLDQKAAIEQRQAAIQELACLTTFRQQFYVVGRTHLQEASHPFDLERLQRLLAEPPYFQSHTIWRILIGLVPALWLLAAGSYLMGWLPGSFFNLFIVGCMVVAYAPTKQVNRIYNEVNKLESLFKGYAELLRLTEQTPFTAAPLQELQATLRHEQASASQAIRRLSRYIGGLDQRFSLAGIILNVLILRDIRHALLLEEWKATYGTHLSQWFDTLAQMDAYNSLGGFAFNHPDYVYPHLTDRYFTIAGKELGHPLLDRKRCVRNDIHLPKAPWFLIITGANMAGKSTYLRTVGINYLLACVGAPVFAKELTLCPAHLVTSLRTSDSLTSHESYFFAELKRLQMIIQRLQQGERLFIILDEILKGTNSIDKQKGSLALMRQLVAQQACGIIATHDLVLGDLEKEYPEAVKNYRFEADIQGDELSFSYQLREGVAQNMNACFLMRKMGITFGTSL